MSATCTSRINGIETSSAIKAPVQVATTANITLSGAQTIDGVAVTDGSRVLVKDQTDATENGIYDASSGVWSRAVDFDGARDAVQGTMVYVSGGTLYAGAIFTLVTASPTIGTSSLTFSQRGWPTAYTYTSRAGLVSDIAAGEYSGSAAGTILEWIEGVAVLSEPVIRRVALQSGATAISDMLGVVPVAPISPGHWGALSESTLNSAIDYAVSLAEAATDDATDSGQTVRLEASGELTIQDQIYIGASTPGTMRGLDVDLSGLQVTVVAGGSLGATDPAFHVQLQDAVFKGPWIDCDKICSGLHTENCIHSDIYGGPRIIHQADGGYGHKHSGADSTLYPGDIREWLSSDTEYATDAEYQADGLVLDGIDFDVRGGDFGWCEVPLRLTSECNNLHIFGIHPFNGRAGSPRIDPDLIVSEAAGPCFFYDSYFDNGYIKDHGGYLVMNGGRFLELNTAVTLNGARCKVYCTSAQNGTNPQWHSIRGVKGLSVEYLDSLTGGYSWAGDFTAIDTFHAEEELNGTNITSGQRDVRVFHRSDDVAYEQNVRSGGLFKQEFHSSASSVAYSVALDYDPISGTYTNRFDTSIFEAVFPRGMRMFADRSALLAADLSNLADGDIVSWRDGTKVLNAIKSTGATDFSGFSDFSPLEPITPNHWGANTTPGTTSMQTAITSAVAYCNTNSLELHWFDQVYSSTATIADLHAVTHTGRGRILRGSDTFYVAPIKEQPNSIYVSTSGSASNDGLTSSQPIRRQDVRSLLANYGPYLPGVWDVVFAAGTYSVTSSYGIRIGPDNETETSPDLDPFTSDHLITANFITFRGPDVSYDPATNPRPSPTAIFDGNNNATVLFDFRGGLRAYVKDISFINADGSSSSTGVLCVSGHLRCENVHTTDCFYGISGLEHCLLEVKGGDITGSSGSAANTGIRSMFHTKHDIGNQNAGAPGEGPFINNCAVGVLAQEGATGHCDHVTFEDNDIAIRTRVNSRVNTNGSDFKRNGACGIAAEAACIGWNGDEEFNIGTADENDNIFIPENGGNIIYFGGEATDFFSYPVQYKEILRKVQYTAHTGTTSETVLESLTFPTGALFKAATGIFAGATIRWRATGNLTGVSGTKVIRIRIGQTSGTMSLFSGSSLPADANGGFIADGEITITGLSTQTYWSNMVSSLGSGDNQAIASGTQTVDFGVDTTYDLQVIAQLGNTADSITVNTLSIEVSGIV